MINKKVQEFGGRICNTCQYYDSLEGWCKKHKCHRYCIDECNKWRTASDLIEHRKSELTMSNEELKTFTKLKLHCQN